jgi:serine/threonine protein kinase
VKAKATLVWADLLRAFFFSFFSFFVLCSSFFALRSYSSIAEFRDLLQQIFQMDPRQRISIHGIMAHPWTGF